LDPPGPRAQATRRGELRFAATLLAIALSTYLSLLSLSYGIAWPLPMLAAAAMAAIAVLHPWSLVRRVCIPLGMVRTATTLTRLGGYPWIRDPEGGAILAGALALQNRSSVETQRWLRANLDRASVRGAGVVAAGLLAAQRGDLPDARALLASIDLLDPVLVPPLARSIALDWLATDAADRRAWGELRTWCETTPSHSSHAKWLYWVALRQLGEAVPLSRGVRAWLRAPARRRNWRLLQRVLRDPSSRWPVVEPHQAAVVAANDGGGIARSAVALHLEALYRGETDALRHSATAWDRTLWNFDFRRRLRARVLALGCMSTVEQLVTALHRDVSEDLAGLLDPSELPEWGTEKTMGEAIVRRRRVVLRILREAATELSTGRRASSPGPTMDVWAACMRVRDAYETLTAFDPAPSARTSYAVVERELGMAAAWLYNTRREHGLAGALSTWLVMQAEQVRDEQAAEHHRWQAALLA
jgi:hypothetical protein